MNRKSKYLWQKGVNKMRVAVLALQGAFIEHEKILSTLGVESFEIRQKRDLLNSFAGLINAAGESSVQGKLIYEL